MSEIEEIGRTVRRLWRERNDEVTRVMKDYDAAHHEKLKELRQRCTALGHGVGRWHSNGFGSSFKTCMACGGTIETYMD